MSGGERVSCVIAKPQDTSFPYAQSMQIRAHIPKNGSQIQDAGNHDLQTKNTVKSSMRLVG